MYPTILRIISTKCMYICVFLIVKNAYSTEVISQPGTYYFGNDITYLASGPNEPIVQISSGDVLVHLNNITIRQDPSTPYPGIDGIVVDPNLDDVTIFKGTIHGLTGAGIRIGSGCSGINVASMMIQECSEGGIIVDGTPDQIQSFVALDNYIFSCTGSPTTPAFGIKINKVRGGLISNCGVALCDALYTNSGYGILCTNCSDFVIKESQTSGNGGYMEGVGMCIKDSTKIFITECDISSNHSWANSPQAFAAGTCFENTTHSTAFHMKSTGNISAGIATGYWICNGSYNSLNDCLADGNSGYTWCSGMILENENQSIIHNSRARTNLSLTGTAYGVYLMGSDNYACNIYSNQLNDNKGSVASFGIVDDRIPSTSPVIQNMAFNNGTNYQVTYTTGVTLPVISAKVTGLPGFPSGTGGILDNIDMSL